MHLRPFLLSACLLGACEKRDAAPGSHSPDIATTKSSLRGGNGETRAATRGGGVTAKSAAVQAIHEWLSAPDGSQLRDDLEEAAIQAIKSADPADFKAIWESMRNVPRAERPLLHAIYYLAAREDIALAARKVQELIYPDLQEGGGCLILDNLVSLSEPTLGETIDFLREIKSEYDRTWVVSGLFVMGGGWHDALTALKDDGYRLTADETHLLMRALVGGGAVGDALTNERVAKTTDLLETVESLEEQGVLAKGARESYLIWIGKVVPPLFLKLIPPEELENQMGKEGSQPVLSRLIRSGRDPVSGSYYPHLFFTPTGTRNFPPEKTNVAVYAWHSLDRMQAEQWFAENVASLPQSQQDLIRAGFARNRWSKDEAAAQAWIDQISDPALREKAFNDRPTDEERQTEQEPYFTGVWPFVAR